MKTWEWSLKILAAGAAVVLLGGCASSAYGPYPAVSPPPEVSNAAPAENVPPAPPASLTLSPGNQNYLMHVDNRTPFVLRFSQADRVLYEKGYDKVGREREADFSVDIALATAARDNPDARAEHMLGGAMLGAAAGALIGAAAHAPVTGAIAGAAGGGVLGLAAPAASPMVRVDVQIQSFRDRTSSAQSVVVDMANVPPYDAQRVIDIQVSKMLEALPSR